MKQSLQLLQTRDAYSTQDLLEVKFKQWIRNYDAYVDVNRRKQFLMKLKDNPVFFALKIMGFKVFKYQEMLLLTKSKRVVAVWGRQSGKTTTISIKVIHFAFTHPNVTVLIISKGLRQSMIMFGVITNFILGNPLLRPSVARYTRTQFHLKNGSRIIALPCSQDGANLRGHTAHMVIMDEAAFMPETVISSVIFPMLATTDGIAIMVSTPWGRNHIFYRSYTNPRYWVQRVKSEECPIIKKSFLAEQRDEIGELRYTIEYEAEFIEDQNALFPQDLIRGCIDGKYQLITDRQILEKVGTFRGEYYLGADLGKRLDYSVIFLLRKETWKVLDKETGQARTIPCFRTVYIKQFELRTKLSVVTDWIIMLTQKFNVRWACIDQTGLGEAVVETLQDRAPNIEGILLSAQRKQEVIMYLYTRMEQQKIVIPFKKELISQMNEQQYYYGSSKTKVIGEEKGVMIFAHPEGRHDDQLWALALAVFATRDIPRTGGVIV